MSSTTTTGATVCVGVCAGMYGCAWVCAGVRGYASVCGMISQNIYWRIESLHQRTLIRILYEFLIQCSKYLGVSTPKRLTYITIVILKHSSIKE